MHVVTPQWLLDCYSKEERPSEETYSCTHLQSDQQSRKRYCMRREDGVGEEEREEGDGAREDGRRKEVGRRGGRRIGKG